MNEDEDVVKSLGSQRKGAARKPVKRKAIQTNIQQIETSHLTVGLGKENL